MCGTTLGPKQRLALGIFLLLIVDVIWVLSAELAREIFAHMNFGKPFFVTYFKTSIFALFLLGFCCMPSWQFLLCRKNRISPSQPPSRTQSAESLKIDPAELLSEPMFVPTSGTPEEEEGLHASINASMMDETARRSEEEEEVVGPLPVNPQRGRCVSELNRSVRFSEYSEIRHMASSHAECAVRSRLSYTASEQLEREERRNASLIDGRLPIGTVMRLSFVFCLLWFIGSYSYSEALRRTVAGVVNVLSATSSLFTLVLAAFLPSSNAEGDRFTASKLFCVFLSIGGVAVVSLGDRTLEHSEIPPGALWALGGALAYALYLVLLRRQVDSDDQISFPMFFGFVGLFNMLLLWPGFFVLDVTHVEPFVMPNSTEWVMLAANGAVGTVLAEVLWLWGCFLTSSLLATLSLSLTTPLTMLADYLFFGKVYGWEIYVGSIPVFLSFVFVAALSHYDNADPLGYCLCSLRRAMLPQWRATESVPYTPRRNTDSENRAFV